MKQRAIELWILITDDKKKAGTLGGLVAVLFLLGIRGFLTGSPETAQAAPGPPTGLEEALRGTLVERLGSASEGAGLIAVPRAARVTRDLFAIDEAYFPQTVQPEHSEPAGGKSASGSSDTVGSGTGEPVPSPEERIAEEASALTLRSTLVGENPVAILVSGSEQYVVSVGGTVAGFVVVEIRSHEVLLEKDGVTLAIERR